MRNIPKSSFPPPPKRIHLGSFYGDQGRKIKEKLEGVSWMNFRVEVCPFMGHLEVWVITQERVSMKAFREMLMFVMAGELAR